MRDCGNLTQEQQGRRKAGFEGERGAELTELGDCEGRDEERKELRVRCQDRRGWGHLLGGGSLGEQGQRNHVPSTWSMWSLQGPQGDDRLCRTAFRRRPGLAGRP